MRIFISYSQRDQEFARHLAQTLRRQGGEPWLSEHGLLAGSDWLTSLKENLQASDALVLIMPSTSAVSGNSAFFEAGAAKAIGKDVIVVVPELQSVDRSNIPYDLASTVVIDASKKPIDVVANTVLGALKADA
jgi:hypothetical protein